MNDDYKKLQIEGSDWSYGSAWGDQMADAISSWFIPQIEKESSVLDVGCGEGRGLDILRASGFKKIAGVDIALDKLNKATHSLHYVIDCDFHCLDSVFAKKQFDYTFTSHTLEHAYDINKAFKSIEYVTAKKTFFIVPIGETPKLVKKINPSHTCPFEDKKQIEDILNSLGYSYELTEKKRMCREVWGIIKYEK